MKPYASYILLLFLVLTKAPENLNAQKVQAVDFSLLLEREERIRIKNDFEKAGQFYDSTLFSDRDFADRWFEIRSLQVLAEREWDRGNRTAARSSLERAHTLAGASQFEDLLLYGLGLEARFAEAEGRCTDALESMKKMRSREAVWMNRRIGQHTGNYLPEEENENRKAEPGKPQTSFRHLPVIIFWVVLLVIALFTGLYRRRKGKQTLAAQPARIRLQSGEPELPDADCSRFFAGMSYELRTPLTLLLGSVHTLLKETQLTERQIRLLQMADRNGKHLEQLIVGLPDFRKSETGKAQTGVPGRDEAEFFPYVGTSEPLPSSSPTILVVEDNPDLRDYIRLILEDQYHVETAENGQAALDWLLTGSNCQLVLSDIMMPVMDGFQLLENLKSNEATRYTPVIMLTARVETQDRLKALRIGVDDYLTKPFEEDELLARIDNLLKNQAARQYEAAAQTGREALRPALSQPDREWLETFEAYVRRHYADGTLNVPGLACEFAMSESTLLRQLKRLTGLSPVQYIQEVRLHEAWLILQNRTCSSIAQVASRVGYDDARFFSRSFRQRFGKLPSELLSP